MRKLFLIALALCVLAGGLAAYFLWPAREDQAARAEYEALRRTLEDVQAGFPGCRDYNALMASRVTGSNGWSALRRASAEAERQRQNNGRFYSVLGQTGWLEFTDTPDVAPDFIALTQSIRDGIEEALRADCIVPVDNESTSAFLKVGFLFDVLASRVNALHSMGRRDDAIAELDAWARLQQRLILEGGFLDWALAASQPGMLRHFLSHRFPPAELSDELVALALQPQRANLHRAMQAELAAAVDGVHELLGSHTFDDLQKLYREPDSESRPLADDLRASRVYLARCAAAYAALNANSRLDDAATVKKLVATLEAIPEDGSPQILTARMVRHAARVHLVGDAAALLLRMRRATPEGLPSREAAAALAADYPALRLEWHMDRVDVFISPDAPIAAVLAKPTDPLASLPAQREVHAYDVSRETGPGRRSFR